jgi:hypothetical protein
MSGKNEEDNGAHTRNITPCPTLMNSGPDQAILKKKRRRRQTSVVESKHYRAAKRLRTQHAGKVERTKDQHEAKTESKNLYAPNWDNVNEEPEYVTDIFKRIFNAEVSRACCPRAIPRFAISVCLTFVAFVFLSFCRPIPVHTHTCINKQF